MHPARDALPAALGQSFIQYIAHMQQSGTAVGAHGIEPCFVVHQAGNGAVSVTTGQRMQVGQRQPAPRGTQDGEPVHVIGTVMQGIGQRQ